MRRRQRWRRAWRGFWTLPGWDRWRYLQGLGMLSCTVWALRWFGFNRWYAALQRLAASVPPASETLGRAQQTRQLLRLIVRYGPYPGNCLSRSLTLWWLLRRQGIDTDLRFGVRRVHGELKAHAWLELQGRPLNAGCRVRQRHAVFAGAIAPVRAIGAKR